MSQPSLVLIGRPEHLPALQSHAPPAGSLVTFVDTEPLQALEAILTLRPSVVAVERTFAGTPRGAALIGRIKADPALGHVDILVVAHDDEQTLEAFRRGGAPAEKTPSPPPAAPVAIDYRGTRRVPRIRMAEHVRVMVDGHSAILVDLSTAGAQVVSTAVLRPNHRVRVVMADERGSVKCVALVAWASFEIPPGSEPRYRAGLQFIDVQAVDVEVYCERHRAHASKIPD